MSLFVELKRRNVFKVGIAYVVASWLLLQLTEVLTELLEIGPEVGKIVIVLLIVGFVPALIFAWAFELTPEGIKREHEVDRSQSIAPQTGRKLDFTIIGMLVLIAGYFIWESRFMDRAGENPGEPVAQAVTDDSPSTAAGESSPASPAYGAATLDASSIAVLPFANRSRLEDDAFFTDGIHDDLLTQLAKIGGIKVISRTSVMQYRDTTRPIADIAAELGVSRILEGGVQRAGDRVRINAQLIDVTNDQHVWAETYDREMTVENLFDIQSEIARHIVQAVRGELTAEETQALAQVPTGSLDAYEAYLHARREIARPEYQMEKYITAGQWLEQALKADPEFGVAWASLVVVHAQYIWQVEDTSPERLALLQRALENAERYAPGQPETLAARADYLYRIESDFKGSEALFEAATRAKPGDAVLLIQLAMAERRVAQMDNAVEHLRLASELDPDNDSARVLLIGTLLRYQQFERAEPLVDQWLREYPDILSFKTHKSEILLYGHGDPDAARELLDSMDPWPGYAYETTALEVYMAQRDFQGYLDLWSRPPLGDLRETEGYRLYMYSILAWCNRYLGDEATARRYAETAVNEMADTVSVSVAGESGNLDALASSHALLGNFDTALELIDRAYALRNENNDSLEGALFGISRARILGLSGQRDAALDEIERLLAVPAGLNQWKLRLHPDWDFLRDAPRFKALAGLENDE